ncbi:hypothetical protein CFELI_08405 [Corynebacterium felinum]|uniref:RNA-binding protein YlxR (DUF448 family) n=1 Tax=Corynebacterium felinum TaxID=131318 RepID=A0ABU2BE02_9CORY|nr:putative RNA-binding protein YlxR (DUF448 family) [Corynebacterium felinum]WJY95286.1 hypothetical protein CFELI_08405 [Corynebacterium felinum]
MDTSFGQAMQRQEFKIFVKSAVHSTSKSERTATHDIRIRTCIATRQQRSDKQLLRIVAGEGTPTKLIPDPHRRLPGRGCWITPSLEAVEQAEKRKAFSRALRVSAAVDTGPVRKYLATLQDLTKNEERDRTLMSTR